MVQEVVQTGTLHALSSVLGIGMRKSAPPVMCSQCLLVKVLALHLLFLCSVLIECYVIFCDVVDVTCQELASL